MARSQVVFTGVVIEAVKNGFIVELDNGVNVLATLSGKIRMNNIRVVPGDTVEVSMSEYDLSKGIIKRRLDS